MKLNSQRDIPTNHELWEEFFGNWVWRAVDALVCTKGFDPSPRWIAERLNITIEEAVDALDALIKLNRIKRSSWGYDYIGTFAICSDNFDHKSKSLSNLYISSQICAKATDYDNTRFSYRIMSGTNEQISNFLSRIDDIILNFHTETDKNQNHENVYAFSFNCINLTPNKY